MSHKIDSIQRPNGPGPTVPPSPADELKASFPTDAAGIEAAMGQGKALAALDPRAFPGFQIITDGSGKEWIVS